MNDHMNTRSPDWLDKIALVFTGKYKSLKSVPLKVGAETLDKAKSKLRIYTNVTLLVATGITLFTLLYSSKQRYRSQDPK
ncbi:unnamed protein product [Gordionus sp. m RMFG-2023]